MLRNFNRFLSRAQSFSRQQLLGNVPDQSNVDLTTSSGATPVFRNLHWGAPHQIALMTTWLATTITIVAMLLLGVRETGQGFDQRRPLLAS